MLFPYGWGMDAFYIEGGPVTGPMCLLHGQEYLLEPTMGPGL